jgi:hypothetical protein
MFWPREIWGKYAKSLGEFKDPANRGAAVECLNDMVRAARAGAARAGAGRVGRGPTSGRHPPPPQHHRMPASRCCPAAGPAARPRPRRSLPPLPARRRPSPDPRPHPNPQPHPTPTPTPSTPAQVTNALQHLPYCLKFMRKLENRDIFRFCAIPQIMAAGTLALCYNNGGVFEGVPWGPRAFGEGGGGGDALARPARARWALSAPAALQSVLAPLTSPCRPTRPPTYPPTHPPTQCTRPPAPSGVVKMRRGETARVFDQCGTMGDVYTWFLQFLRQLGAKAAAGVAPGDPTVEVRPRGKRSGCSPGAGLAPAPAAQPAAQAPRGPARSAGERPSPPAPAPGEWAGRGSWAAHSHPPPASALPSVPCLPPLTCFLPLTCRVCASSLIDDAHAWLSSAWSMAVTCGFPLPSSSPPSLQTTREAVASSIALCEEGLKEVGAAGPRRLVPEGAQPKRRAAQPG